MDQNGSLPGLVGYEDIASHYNKAVAKKGGVNKQELAAKNKQKEIQFKASHTVLIGFFLAIAVLHGLGIYLFTKGFLLTRLVLDEKSKCSEPPFKDGSQHLGTHKDGCWHPKTFDKAVVVIIDALRYDFTVPRPGSTMHCHNALSVLHETAVQSPERAFLLPFIADPPTTTLQRLKGLTTGTLPTFIDAGSNFAGTAIEEDNLIAQLLEANKTLVHLGDDTWHSLFPGYFDANLTHAYDSFNVWDLFTVDNGVNEHLFPLLSAENRTKWDVLFGHYLGVDHAGHRYGPNHPATAGKLQEMDQVIRKMIDALDDETLLVIMGDHGMDVKGDHGGESDDEVEAALWMYSKKGVFGRGHNDLIEPPVDAKERPVGQIDLVPTLSLLLGMPIPFNNLGAPIAEAFVGPGKPDWSNLASVNALAAVQINKYQHEYSIARGLDDSIFAGPQRHWQEGLSSWESALETPRKVSGFKAPYESFQEYQRETLAICRSLWARFDIPSMLQGVVILAFGVGLLTIYARSSGIRRVDFAALTLGPMSIFGLAAGLVIMLGEYLLNSGFYMKDSGLPGMHGSLSVNAFLFGLAVGTISGFAFSLFKAREVLSFPFPRSVWGWLAIIFTVSQSAGYASNSFTIWEDEIMLSFLGTFAIFAFVSSARLEVAIERNIGMAQSAVFLAATRLVSLSRLCREEQMPYCRSTYYASSTSSTSAPWQLAIPFIVLAALPFAIEAYFKETSSYQGMAKYWIGIVLRVSLLGTAIFWILDAADDNKWLAMDESILKNTKMYLARAMLVGVAAVGTSSFCYRGTTIKIDLTTEVGGETDKDGKPKPKSVKIYGMGNVHGSRYALLLVNSFMVLVMTQKPMGNGALAILTVQILALLDIIDANSLSQSAIGPTVLGLLGSFHFFKTGHQATLSSIQWESAFIPLSTIKYPWSPLLVVLNTYGAQILTAIAVPLIALWKQPATKRGLLGNVAKVLATMLLYYAVINLATIMWAGHLRRHLMLYRIFSPRYMSGAAVLLVVDIVGALVSLGLLRWNFQNIAEVFGWA